MKIKNINQNFYKKRKGVSIIVLMASVIAIFSIAGFVIDFGIILNTRAELQKLVETTAMAAVSDYEAYENPLNSEITYPNPDLIKTGASSLFDKNLNSFISTNSFLQNTKNISSYITFGNTIQSRFSRAIKIELSGEVKTYFLNIIGIRSIKIRSIASAMHTPLYLKSGNIINGTSTSLPIYSDTNLRSPVGGATSTATINTISYTLPAISNINTNFANIYGVPDANVVSLGPGGYITIKPTLPIVNGKGFDFQILTRGNASGYFVFVGNDTDPTDPYIDAANPGGGISWQNVSCTGTPIGAYTGNSYTAGGVTVPNVGSYNQWIDLNSNSIVDANEIQPKFYGSGYFDLGARCTNSSSATIYDSNIQSAKYIKIIDDNIEDGFILRSPRFSSSMTAIPSFFPGQNNSMTPGVSIDSIAIEHHPKLIGRVIVGAGLADALTQDTDSDGLIDVFEQSLGLNPAGATDGMATNKDAEKFWGYRTSTAGVPSETFIDNPTNQLRIDYVKNTDSPPKFYVNY